MKFCFLMTLFFISISGINNSYAMEYENYQGTDSKGYPCEVQISKIKEAKKIGVTSFEGDLSIHCSIHHDGRVHSSCGSSETHKGSEVTLRSTQRNEIGLPQANRMDLKFSKTDNTKLLSVSCQGTFALSFISACLQLNSVPKWKQNCNKLRKVR